MNYFLLIAQFLLTLAAAPFMIGMVRKAKARFQNRRGASVFQPYWALMALMKKDMTITRYSSWVFRLVPFVVLAVAAILALVIPTLAYGIIPDALSNVFLIGALAALGSAFLVLGGMDTASTFGNMGSSREMTLAALVEPAFFVTLATLGLLAHTWGLDGIVSFFAAAPWVTVVPVASLTIGALFLVLLTENARYPVDNPATHLELTMVHEAMVLEYSGPYLAMLEYSSAIKLTAMSILLMDLVLPFGLLHMPLTPLGIVVALLAFFGKLLLAAFLVAFVESTVVKMRFYRMQEFLSMVAMLASAGLVLVLVALHS